MIFSLIFEILGRNSGGKFWGKDNFEIPTVFDSLDELTSLITVWLLGMSMADWAEVYGFDVSIYVPGAEKSF